MYAGTDIKQGETADTQIIASAANTEEMTHIELLYENTPHTWFQWDLAGTQLLNGRPYVKT